MTIAEIQDAPYNFRYTTRYLDMSRNEHGCFIGDIESFKQIKDFVMGIFLKAIDENPVNGFTYLQAFCYDSPKYQFNPEDCPQATHVLIKNNIEEQPTMEDYKVFLQGLATSDINKEMVIPAKDPFQY
jgi:hypothetical protein